MTTPRGQEPARASAMKRYGPLIGVVGVIAVIAVVITIAGKKDPSATDSTKTTGGSNDVGISINSDIPITYAQAKAQGKEGSITWVDNCDPATGRIKMPSVYAPPCVPKVEGNGGATTGGVTATEITIVNYIPSQNGDLQALLAGNLDDEDKMRETRAKYLDMFASLFETYGRKINLVEFQSNSAPDDATGGHADAVSVVERFHPFASIGGPALNPAYADELARQKVICIGCGLSNPDQFYQDHAPYLWGPQPTPEEFLVNLADYMTTRVVGHKAEFAGDPELKSKDRKFGVVHFEQNPPVFSELGAKVAECGAARGWQAALTETYTFDIGKFGERATTIIAKMKAEGITTILFLGDPIMPIYLTKQATAQNYFPEWIVTGTVLTDTTVLGRKYDQEQMKHAFGISNLPARIPRKQAEPWRMHQWFYGTDPAAVNTNALIYGPYQQIMLGIHMAGPKLTPETFRDGMFNYPLSGGGPTTPQVSYGDHGYFTLPGEGAECTSDRPRLDYLGTDDMTEIWWDATAEGQDEQEKTDAPGMWRYANMGKRYLPGKMEPGEIGAFKMENSITVYETPPEQDRPPSYPSPAGIGSKGN